ncbi:MAG: YfhO family protein [Armatimonadota bacterium]|nr:YfhO family protein [Armatimonadota bacterium]
MKATQGGSHHEAPPRRYLPHLPAGAARLAGGDGAAYLLFLGVACLLLWPVVFRGEVLLPAQYLHAFYPWRAEGGTPPNLPPWNALLADSVLQYLPWRHFMRQCLHSGYLPLWNPHQLCGTPLVANYQSALFYPPNLLFWILPTAYAFGWSALLHLFLAGAFFFVFLRGRGLNRTAAVVGGLTFELCGALVAWLELPTAVNVAVWLPLALHRYERARTGGGTLSSLATAFPLAMVLLAGHPQFALYALYAFLGYVLCHLPAGTSWRQRLAETARCLGVPVVLALLLASPQLLPLFEFSRASHRGGGSPLLPNPGSYQLQALPFWASVVLLVPDFFGNPSRGDYWGLALANYAEFSGYAGVVPVLLGLFVAAGLLSRAARRRWERVLPEGSPRTVGFFAGMALLSVAAAFRTPLGLLFHRVAPGLGGFGSPGRMLLLYSVATAVLAAYGAQVALQPAGMPKGEGKQRAFPALAVAAAATAMGGLGLAWAAAAGAAAMGAGTPAQVILAQSLSLARFLVLLLAGALVLGVGAAGRLSPHSARAFTVGLIAADLLLAGWGFNPTSHPSLVYSHSPVIQALRALGPDARFVAATPRWSLDDFPTAILPPNGATALGLNDVNGYDSLYLLAYKELLNRIAGGETSPPANGNMVLFRTYGAPAFRQLGCPYVLTLTPVHAPGFRLLRDGPVKLYQVTQALPRAFVASNPDAEPMPDAWVNVQYPSATRVVVTLQTPRRGYLVLLDTLCGGWRAWVDGEPTAIRTARWVFRAVPLPPGRHRVEFRYQPASVRTGLFLGLLAIACAAGAAAFAAASSRRSRH